MKILIFGASDAGSTTLGKDLSVECRWERTLVFIRKIKPVDNMLPA